MFVSRPRSKMQRSTAGLKDTEKASVETFLKYYRIIVVILRNTVVILRNIVVIFRNIIVMLCNIVVIQL